MGDLVPFGDFFGDLDEMRKKLDRMFSAGMLKAGRLGQEALGIWYPAIDVQENDQEVIVSAELPGVVEENINIEADENSLTLSGKREERHEIEDKKTGYLRRERSFGSFSRTVTLPSAVDPAKSEAEFVNGVLTVHLPKVDKGKKGKKIEIKKG
jgi:HSP20 family protein